MQMKDKVLAFFADDEGLTMVEYAIAGALVAAGAVLVFTNLGNAIVTAITNLTTAVAT